MLLYFATLAVSFMVLVTHLSPWAPLRARGSSSSSLHCSASSGTLLLRAVCGGCAAGPPLGQCLQKEREKWGFSLDGLGG
jgi:hypothetical protein